jgi:hypothetical protein
MSEDEMKIAISAFTSTLLLVAASGICQAQELCFQLNNFNDVFTLNFIDSGQNALVVGQDVSLTNSIPPQGYTLPLVGSAAPAPPPNTNPSVMVVGLHGVNTTSFFGNHSDCTIDFLTGTASPPILNLSCVGRTGGLFNRRNVPATIIDCTAASASGQAVRHGFKALGQD